MKNLSFLFLLLTGTVLFAVGRGVYPYKAYHQQAGAQPGYATITLDNTRVKIGEKFTVHLRFYSNTNNDFFNPFFQPLRPMPACLVLYDQQHNYLGTLMDTATISARRTVRASDWCYIPAGSFIGTPLGPFIAGNGLNAIIMKHSLPAGDYYLQVVYFKAFVAPSSR